MSFSGHLCRLEHPCGGGDFSSQRGSLEESLLVLLATGSSPSSILLPFKNQFASPEPPDPGEISFTLDCFLVPCSTVNSGRRHLLYSSFEFRIFIPWSLRSLIHTDSDTWHSKADLCDCRTLHWKFRAPSCSSWACSHMCDDPCVLASPASLT